MLRSWARSRGTALLAVVVLLSVLALAYFLSQGAIILASATRKYTAVQDAETRIQRSLLQYVAINSRLPCPARPDLAATDANSGLPLSDSPDNSVCKYPGGVVPWKVLGLSVDDVTDSWGRLISYRVFDGTRGLTRTGGMSKVNCDLSNAGGFLDTAGNRVALDTALDVNGFCNAAHNTLATSFTTDASYTGAGFVGNGTKGFVVTDYGVQKTTIAYVLISHGPSGLGGYTASGSRLTLPGVTASDYNNTLARDSVPTTIFASSPPGFQRMEHSVVNDPDKAGYVAPGGTGHYDDVIAYLSIDDVARLASVDARNWPETVATATAPIPALTSASVGDMTSTTSTTAYHVSMTTAANSGQQFQANASNGTTIDGLAFGAIGGNYGSCTWAPNAVDLYKAPTAQLASGTSWSGGVITFRTVATHGLATGDQVTVSGTAPSGYDGTGYTVTSVPNSTTFRVASASNPGAWVAGGSVKKLFTVTTATWSADVITFTTSTAHGLSAGTDTVQVTGTSPDGYSGTFTVASTPTSTTFTVSAPGDPGTFASGGTVVKGFKRALMVSVEAAFNNTNAGGGLVFGFLPTQGTYANATASSGISLDPVSTITSASALLGFATVTLSGPPPFKAGEVVTIAGVPAASLLGIPLNLNGTWTVNSVSGNSFTVGGLLSGPLVLFGSGGTVTSSLCGSPSNQRIAWDNDGETATTDGNLPAPRFGIEPDLSSGTTTGFNPNDPSRNHAAIDFSGVAHSTTTTSATASSCSTGASTYHSTSDPVSTVTNAAWASTSGGRITFTTSAAHGLAVGTVIAVDGVSPAGYNGTYIVTAAPSGTTFRVTQPDNPGSYASGGTVTRSPTNYLTTGTSWTGSVYTFVTALPHNLAGNASATGNQVIITGALPSGYNGTFNVISTPSANTFTATRTTSAGTAVAWTSGGNFGGNDCYTGPSTSWLMNGIPNFHTARIEVEPYSPSCSATAPLVKFWLLPYLVCHPTANLTTGTTWSGGVLTFQTTSVHGFAVGDSVTVTGALPAAFNGTFTVASVPSSTRFTVASAANPGIWLSGGTPVSAECAGMTSVTARYQPTRFPATGIHIAQCVPTPDPANAFDSVYFGFTSNNATTTNTQNNLILQNLNSGLITLP